MPPRRKKKSPKPAPKRDWKTTTWYVIGALIILAMVFSLFASALGS